MVKLRSVPLLVAAAETTSRGSCRIDTADNHRSRSALRWPLLQEVLRVHLGALGEEHSRLLARCAEQVSYHAALIHCCLTLLSDAAVSRRSHILLSHAAVAYCCPSRHCCLTPPYNPRVRCARWYTIRQSSVGRIVPLLRNQLCVVSGEARASGSA